MTIASSILLRNVVRCEPLMNWQSEFRWWIRVKILALVLCSVGASWLGCSSTHFDGRHYRRGPLEFTLGPAPKSWRNIEVSDALLAFRDDGRHATIAVHGRCGKDGDDVPLEALTQHLFIHFTERETLDQRLLSMDDREAMRSEITAKLDGVPKQFVVYVLKKDGCVYDFFYIGESSMAATGVEAFDNYVATFRTYER